jgi:hypothetical protein
MQLRSNSTLAMLSAAFAVGGLLACSDDFSSDCENTATCDPPADSGADGNGGSGGQGGSAAGGGSGGRGGATGGTSGNGNGGDAGGGGDGGSCDASKSPSEDACVIDERYGVFVSPSGDDATADGTKDNPFGTLGKGLSAAKAAGKRVYACADGGSYAENIGATPDGLEVFGGFACESWSDSSTAKARIQSPDPVAWKATGLSTGLRVEDFEVVAANATRLGSSSFAMVVSDSQDVVLRRVKLVAGDGANGAPGENGAVGEDGQEAGEGQAGKDACTAAPTGSQLGGGWPSASACGSEGGAGGTAFKSVTTAGGNGNPGQPQTNVTPPGINNGGSGALSAALPGTSGTQGSPGNPGSSGTAAAEVGLFSATGYAPADGKPGHDGFPGQGGGGGGASVGNGTCVGASGGAGGMGGCGGTKGTGGGGGGASVALMAWNSAVTLDSAELVAGNGGDGAKGGDSGRGGAGKRGGSGGAGAGLAAGGSGGDGGSGGPGGSGSGGTGGPSIALVYSGTAPSKLGQTNLVAGDGGAKGAGGSVQVVAINKAPDGSPGMASQEYEQK